MDFQSVVVCEEAGPASAITKKQNNNDLIDEVLYSFKNIALLHGVYTHHRVFWRAAILL